MTVLSPRSSNYWDKTTRVTFYTQMSILHFRRWTSQPIPLLVARVFPKISMLVVIITTRKPSLGQGSVSTLSVCSRGGVVGFPACITGHMTRGVCLGDGGGVASRGMVCIWRGLRPGDVGIPPQHYGIRSRSRRYPSYWNAFLF